MLFAGGTDKIRKLFCSPMLKGTSSLLHFGHITGPSQACLFLPSTPSSLWVVSGRLDIGQGHLPCWLLPFLSLTLWEKIEEVEGQTSRLKISFSPLLSHSWTYHLFCISSWDVQPHTLNLNSTSSCCFHCYTSICFGTISDCTMILHNSAVLHVIFIAEVILVEYTLFTLCFVWTSSVKRTSELPFGVYDNKLICSSHLKCASIAFLTNDTFQSSH